MHATPSRTDTAALAPLPTVHTAFWRDRASEEALRTPVPARMVEEIETVLPGLSAPRLGEQPTTPLDPTTLRDALPVTCETMAAVRAQLDDGVGATILDRFPAHWSDELHRRAAWLTGTMIGPLRAQSHDGTRLYDVVDTRGATTSRRASKTNSGQPWHTDGPWHAPAARYIALYCVRPAAHGGESLVASLATALDDLAKDDPEALAVLMTPLPWDRQGEHEADDVPVAWLPVAAGDGIARWYERYNREGARLAGESLPAAVLESMEKVRERLDAQSTVQFTMKAGEMQIVNNHRLVHARGSFEDDDAHDGPGRTLHRLWMD